MNSSYLVAPHLSFSFLPFQRNRANNCVYIEASILETFERIFFSKGNYFNNIETIFYRNYFLFKECLTELKITLLLFTFHCSSIFQRSFKKFPIFFFLWRKPETGRAELLMNRELEKKRRVFRYWKRYCDGQFPGRGDGNEGEPGCKQASFVRSLASCNMARHIVPVVAHAAIKL